MTHHDLEVVTGYNFLSVLHPADSRWGVSCDSTLKLDVRGLISIRVAGIVQELRRHCRNKQMYTLHHEWSLKYGTSWYANTGSRGSHI